MIAKIWDILIFLLGLRDQYIGCKQSLGGVVPNNSCDMQMPRQRRCRDKEGFEYIPF